MTRADIIYTIESLYPADSDYQETRKIGVKLLEQAKREVDGWRTLPDDILLRYAQLCEEFHESDI